jgi:TolB protein
MKTEGASSKQTGIERGKRPWVIPAVVLGILVIMIVLLVIMGWPKIIIIPAASPTIEWVVNTAQPKTAVPANEITIEIDNTTTTLVIPTSTEPYVTPFILTNTPIPFSTATATMELSQSINQEPTGKIVYACEVVRDNIYDQICMVNADGTGQRQLTNREGSATYPTLSPDGNHVIYISNETGDHAIYDLDLTTGQSQQLTPELGDPAGPRISPDGSLIAFSNNSDNIMSLYLMNRDGSGIHTIYTGGGERPSWSPDGSQLSFYNGYEGKIFVIDANGGNPHPIISTTHNCASTSWSPNGKNIAICQGDPERQIFMIDVSGGNLQQVTTSGDNAAPNFSPDGNWIGFLCKPDSQSTKAGEICIIRTDGTDRRTLTHNSLLDWLPYWGQ